MKIFNSVMRRNKELPNQNFPIVQMAGEQERNLWIASRRYVIGEIKTEELEALELIETEKFKNAVYMLAKRQLRQRFRQKFFRIWKIGGWKKQNLLLLLLF